MPHYGIDVVDPTSGFRPRAGRPRPTTWIESAREIDKRTDRRRRNGTLHQGAVRAAVRRAGARCRPRGELARELESMSVAELRRWCNELDPARAHLGRTQLLRAIEMALLSGSRISDLHSLHNAARDKSELDVSPAYLVVDPGPSLAERIETRVERMLDERLDRRGRGAVAQRSRPTLRRGRRAAIPCCESTSTASSICQPRGSGSLLRHDSTRSGSEPGSGTSCLRRP